MYDLIILGGGPAGLTAAVYAIRKRLNVLLISPDLGGKTAWRLELPDNLERFQAINGDELVTRFKTQIEHLDFVYMTEKAEKVQVNGNGYSILTREGHSYQTKTILVATGTRAMPLNVPGESKYRLRGLAYSAVSYAPLFIDRVAAVVGGGELGNKSALELAQVARQVYLIVPDSSALDTPAGRKLLTAKNVIVLDGYAIKEIKGDETYARSLVVSKGDLVDELQVDVTFVELELTPNSECVAGLVKTNDKKQIIVDSYNRTSQPGIFAAGDVTDIYAEQVLICIGEGAKAALSAYELILST